MTRSTLAGAALALAVLAGACERDERTARQELSTAAREDPGYRTDAPAAVVPVPDTLGGQTLTGNLAEMHNSGASGVVTVTPRDGGTMIQLSVRGAQPNTTLQPTIHRGGCAEAGQLAVRLQRLPVDDTGIAGDNLVIDQEIGTIADGRHSVRIYTEQAIATPPIACADLPTPAAPTRM